jgi:hypothetical protein
LDIACEPGDPTLLYELEMLHAATIEVQDMERESKKLPKLLLVNKFWATHKIQQKRSG